MGLAKTDIHVLYAGYDNNIALLIYLYCMIGNNVYN